MKKYEAIFILDIRKVEDDGAVISSEIAALVKKWGGEMVKSISLGRRQFAYEVNKRKGGIYWNYVFTAGPDKVKELKENFRLDERVLRNMIINFDLESFCICNSRESSTLTVLGATKSFSF